MNSREKKIRNKEVKKYTQKDRENEARAKRKESIKFHCFWIMVIILMAAAVLILEYRFGIKISTKTLSALSCAFIALGAATKASRNKKGK